MQSGGGLLKQGAIIDLDFYNSKGDNLTREIITQGDSQPSVGGAPVGREWTAGTRQGRWKDAVNGLRNFIQRFTKVATL